MDSLHQALVTILNETFNGPPGDEAFMLNPGDPGLIGQLDVIDAVTASSRPMPAKTTIASHVDHVLYGFELLNRWADGEKNPWATADWSASWKRTTVDDAAWLDLRSRLKVAAGKWQAFVAKKTDWDHLGACGALSSAAHTMYHFGAIRQILAAMGR
jgi:hypothetical protein